MPTFRCQSKRLIAIRRLILLESFQTSLLLLLYEIQKHVTFDNITGMFENAHYIAIHNFAPSLDPSS